MKINLLLGSTAFSDEIGKVIASGNRLVVTGDKNFHVIDISVPTKPVIQSTTNLPTMPPEKEK